TGEHARHERCHQHPQSGHRHVLRTGLGEPVQPPNVSETPANVTFSASPCRVSEPEATWIAVGVTVNGMSPALMSASKFGSNACWTSSGTTVVSVSLPNCS